MSNLDSTWHGTSGMHTYIFNGHRVFIVDDIPRMQVSADFARLQSHRLLRQYS